MANTITAGNATNNGASLASDASGTLAFVTGSGAGTTALTIDGSQNATFAGTVTSPTGALYPLSSGTAVASTSGTSITFTGIPSTAKRITVMFNGVSTNSTSVVIVQIGAGSIQTTGYVCAAGNYGTTSALSSYTTGFAISAANVATATIYGSMTITNISTNTWVESFSGIRDTGAVANSGGGVSLGGALDRVSITTVNGTDTFDAGSINILWE